ncbi:MAG TPA: hypothetical protein PLA50_18520, partial [Bacteroidia bacterium]|nr:hypothetical protein [Bacteroidia bacterium]
GGTGGMPIAENAPEMLVSPDVHSPQLFLAEEVSDLSSLDLVDGADGLAGEVDASYLESKSIVPASFIPGQPGRTAFSEDRVDSYLPPVRGTGLRGMNTGMIERRLGRVPVGGGDTRASSVLVSGYVTMGSENGAAEAPRFLGGFRPVAISGNPVVNEESDLRLLADLNGLQKELSEVIAGMPVENAERARLERIRDRSDRVISQLKREISH